MNGTYFKKDVYEAIKWYEKAIEHGFATSASNLGLIYMCGENGVPLDLERPERLLIWSYTGGEINASMNLVDLYLSKHDHKRALIWHEIAKIKSPIVSDVRDEPIRQLIKRIKSGIPIKW